MDGERLDKKGGLRGETGRLEGYGRGPNDEVEGMTTDEVGGAKLLRETTRRYIRHGIIHGQQF